jgi:hypothetical protein
MSEVSAQSAPGRVAAGSGRDRRRFPRVRGPFDGTWVGAGGNGAARVWDLSVGGCFIDALGDERQGEVVTITIVLPEGEVQVTGEVVYSVHNQGFAVQFTDLSAGSRQLLALVVERLLAAGYGI